MASNQEPLLVVGKLIFDIALKFLCYGVVFKLYQYVKPRLWRTPQHQNQPQKTGIGNANLDPEQLMNQRAPDCVADSKCDENTSCQNKRRNEGADKNASEQYKKYIPTEEGDFLKEAQTLLANIKARKPYVACGKKLTCTRIETGRKEAGN